MKTSGEPRIFLQSWTAFAPGLPTREDWENWLGGAAPYDATATAKPPLVGVPAAYKRRCSLLTTMVLDTYLSLAQENGIDIKTVWSIFASRHGEIGVLEGLFSDLHREEPMSPIDFCNSVHHTPTGYFGIIAKNTSLTRTISADHDTFACALLDTVGLLTESPDQAVLLAVADIPVPSAFGTAEGDVPFPHAMTFLLTGSARPGARNHPVTAQDALSMMGATNKPESSAVFDFTKGLLR